MGRLMNSDEEVKNGFGAKYPGENVSKGRTANHKNSTQKLAENLKKRKIVHFRKLPDFSYSSTNLWQEALRYNSNLHVQ